MITDEQRAHIRRLFFAEHWKVGTIAGRARPAPRRRRAGASSRRASWIGGQLRARTLLDPYRDFIDADARAVPAAARDAPARDAVATAATPAASCAVRRYVRRVRPHSRHEAFLSAHHAARRAGAGRLGLLRQDRGSAAGSATLSCFVMVLSWSRAIFARFTLDQTLESFVALPRRSLRALRRRASRRPLRQPEERRPRARRAISSAFTRASSSSPATTTSRPSPCAIARGNEKGRVERASATSANRFFAARASRSVDDLNRQLDDWIERVAHARARPGRADERTVARRARRGAARLLPLPEHRFRRDLRPRRRVGQDALRPLRPQRLLDPAHPRPEAAHARRVGHHRARPRRRRPRSRATALLRRAAAGRGRAHLAALAAEKRKAREHRGRNRLVAACPSADEFLDESPFTAAISAARPSACSACSTATAPPSSKPRSPKRIVARRLRRASPSRTSSTSGGAREAPPPIDVVAARRPARARSRRHAALASTATTASRASDSRKTRSPDERLFKRAFARSASSRRRGARRPRRARHQEALGAHAAPRARRRCRGAGPRATRPRAAPLAQPPRRFKPMADFDWNWPTKIDRPLVESAVALDFLDGARNVVLVAPQGLGKTMIAQNIAHQAILAGHSVLFITAAQLLLDLGGQESARALDRRLQHYAKHRSARHRRDRLPRLRQPQRRPALPGRQPSLREEEPRPHHQPRLQRLADHLPERHLRHRAHRSRRPPRRRHRHRGRELPRARGGAIREAASKEEGPRARIAPTPRDHHRAARFPRAAHISAL